MPRYFFHLSFGNRTCRDEEGVELPNRAAARAETLAVIRDLTHGRDAENGSGWAGWVLHVADAEGQFFSRPIDQRALVIAAYTSRSGPVLHRPVNGRLTELAQRLLETRLRMTNLLKQNERLRGELASELRRGAQLTSVARNLLGGAPLRRRRSRPRLVVLKGGKR